MNNLFKNSKSEILNSRQIRINRAQSPKQTYHSHHREETLGSERFGHLNSGLRCCVVFRISRLGFAQKEVI